MPDAEAVTIAEFARRVRAVSAGRPRTIIGIVGEPGAGKSTVAAAAVAALSPDAALVPMDGFHLSNDVLSSLGLRGRKGAPETFDAAGYIALLRRLRTQDDEIVYAPTFLRDIEEPIASSLPVRRETPIVITEGNYLLLDEPPWDAIATLLDTAWYIDVSPDVRLTRLVDRHIAFGKRPEDAHAWAHGSDQRNAVRVAKTVNRANHVFSIRA